MATQQDDDENKKSNPLYQSDPQNPQMLKTQPTDGGMGGGTNNAKPVAYPFQRTLQTPSASQPGQQTAMPWSQMAPTMANFGRSSTPWAQTMQPQAPVQGQQGAPQGLPNWQALAQRFGGGNVAGQATAPSPAFQQPRFQLPFQGAGAAGGGGFQLPPYLQQAAAAIAARGGGFGGPQGAIPSGGSGMAMPNWGGAQGLPIFNQQRNVY